MLAGSDEPSAPPTSATTQQTAEDAASEREERKQHATNERLLVWYTGALFVTTFGLMIVTGGLWMMALRQARDTKESLAIAAQSAAAARDSADVARQTFTRLERPYVFINEISGLKGPSETVRGSHIRFNLANLGRSPAFVTDLWAELFITANPIPREVQQLFFADESLHKMGDIISGDGKIENFVCYMPAAVTEKLDDIENRDTYLLLKAQILYTDIFGQKHHSSAHWLYHADKDYFASYVTEGVNSFD